MASKSSDRNKDTDNLIAGRYLIEQRISKLEKATTYSVLDSKHENDRF